jgi:hypothetical protein
MRYSIWGREYGADHDVELAQVNSNPQPVLDGLAAKSLQISLSMFPGGRKTKVPKYSWLRIIDNENTL